MSYRHTSSASLLLTTSALIACPGDTATTSEPGSSSGEPGTTGSSSSSTGDVPTGTDDTPTTTDPSTGATTGETTTSGTTDASSSTGDGLCHTFLCGAPASCCGADDDCVAGTCVAGCASDVRCGADLEICCADGEVCIGGACTARLGDCAGPGDCDPPGHCDIALGKCIPPPEDPTCEYPKGQIGLTAGWAFTSDEVTTMPLVVDLDGDGVSEVVVNSMRAKDKPADYAYGELICLDGATGEEIWRIADNPQNGKFGAHGRTTLAAGDVDGDERPDIIYPGRPEGTNFISPIYAVDGDGVLLWTSHNLNNTVAKIRVQNGAPALANLDDDPMTEIAYGAAIYDHDGLLVWNQDENGGVFGSPHVKNKPSMLLYSGGLPTFADLTGDGHPELITGREAWSIDWVSGEPPDVTLTLLWKDTSGFAGDGWPAVADLDDNGTPEVVLVAYPEIKVLDGETGKLWCGVDPTGVVCANNDAKRTPPFTIPGGNLGGPATIADFDRDGRPEFGLTTGTTYEVFDLHRPGEVIVQPMGESVPQAGAIFTRWRTPVQDDSSASTGSTAFDLDADGAAEVFYQDECRFRVYDGPSGKTLLELPNSTATIHEYPVISNVDADDDTDLLIVANLSDPNPNAKCLADDPMWAPRKGVYLYHPTTAWAPTRRGWTNHAYHVTNVESDGNVPLSEQDNWTTPGLNNFRQALGGYVLHDAPDLQASLAVDLAKCTDAFVLRATVFNAGELGLAAGIDVTVYAGTDELGAEIATLQTSEAIGPGGSTVVETTIPAPVEPANYFVLVDPSGLVGECFEENNGALVFGAACPG